MRRLSTTIAASEGIIGLSYQRITFPRMMQLRDKRMFLPLVRAYFSACLNSQLWETLNEASIPTRNEGKKKHENVLGRMLSMRKTCLCWAVDGSEGLVILQLAKLDRLRY